MLELNRIDLVARQTLADHAVFARTALLRVYYCSPEVLGVIDLDRWQGAQRRAARVLEGLPASTRGTALAGPVRSPARAPVGTGRRVGPVVPRARLQRR